MLDLPWCNIWLADNPAEVLNEHLSVLVGRHIPTKVIHVCNKDEPWCDHQYRSAFCLKQEDYLRWTRDRSRVNWEELVCCQVRPNENYRKSSTSLVTEKGMFFWMSCPLISGGTLLSLWYSARFRLCLRLLLRVVAWCVSRLVRLIYCWMILTESSRGRLLICRSFAILLLVLPPLLSARMRSSSSHSWQLSRCGPLW